MLDVGNRDRVYERMVPEGDFLSIRGSDPHQHRYFLGDQFEGIPLGKIQTGAQLTPARKVIHRNVDTLSPWDSRSFFSRVRSGCPPLS